MAENTKTVTDSIVQEITTAYPIIKRYFADITSSQPIPFSQIQLLKALQSSGKLTISALAKLSSMAKPNITPAIDALEQKKFVRRERNPQDRRSVYVEMLDEGYAYLERYTVDMDARIVHDCEQLSNEEAEKLNDALKTINTLIARF